jgi:GNAT superfamily N-acetyltransferase
MTLLIRDFDEARDRAAALAFIDGSQAYEHAFEPDRRLDGAVAGEHYAVLMARVAKKRGRIFMACEGARALGWAVFHHDENMIYVVEAERAFGYIAELFVVEDARGRGIGRALIEACEAHARAEGLGHIMIGVLARNKRTADIYAQAGYAPYAVEMRKYL